MSRVKALLFLLWLTISLSQAQNMARVYYNLDTLCAPGMHGRGAAFNGDKVAAGFIGNYFKRFGLTPLMLDSAYIQPFLYDINTFEQPIKIVLGNKKPVLGKDYILHPASGKGKGKFKALALDTAIFTQQKVAAAFFKHDLSKKAVVINSKDLKKINSLDTVYQAKLMYAGATIEVVEKKLTASLSDDQYPRPWLQVLPNFLLPLPKKIQLETAPVLKQKYLSQNIVGMIRGTANTDSFLVITAHYDHLGRMGSVYFPGANDNASGITMLIELMSHFARRENRPLYNLIFIAFGAEEAGLIGSRHFVENPLVDLKKIKFLVNLDMLGSGDDGMMVVNGGVHNEQFARLEKLNTSHHYLPEIKKRGKAANSDHYWFTQRGVPAFFFYTLGGVTHYHDIFDVPQTLPLTRYGEVYHLIIDFVKGF